MVQLHLSAFNGLLIQKNDLLKTRVVIYAYQQHVRLLAPELMVVKQPQSTRVKKPTLLCNQVGTGTASVLKRDCLGKAD